MRIIFLTSIIISRCHDICIKEEHHNKTMQMNTVVQDPSGDVQILIFRKFIINNYLENNIEIIILDNNNGNDIAGNAFFKKNMQDLHQG